MSLTVGWENGPERIHLTLDFMQFKQAVQIPIRRLVLVASDLGMRRCQCPSQGFTDSPLYTAH